MGAAFDSASLQLTPTPASRRRVRPARDSLGRLAAPAAGVVVVRLVAGCLRPPARRCRQNGTLSMPEETSRHTLRATLHHSRVPTAVAAGRGSGVGDTGPHDERHRVSVPAKPASRLKPLPKNFVASPKRRSGDPAPSPSPRRSGGRSCGSPPCGRVSPTPGRATSAKPNAVESARTISTHSSVDFAP